MHYGQLVAAKLKLGIGGKTEAEFICQDIEPLPVEDHNMVVDRGFGKQAKRGSYAMDHIVSEDGRRGNDDLTAWLQGLHDLAQQLLLVEYVLDQSQHEDRVETRSKIEGVYVQIPDMELGVREFLGQALDENLVPLDSNVTSDLRREAGLGQGRTAAKVEDISLYERLYLVQAYIANMFRKQWHDRFTLGPL